MDSSTTNGTSMPPHHHHHHTPRVQVLCREVIVRLEDPEVRKAQSEAMFFENDKTVVRVNSCCDCPHKIIPVNTVHSGGRVKLMPSQRNFLKKWTPGGQPFSNGWFHTNANVGS